jgi:hypothetical protein
MRGSIYDEVAAEYYDAGRHPTCANLRALSVGLLAAWADRLAPPVVELGAGRSSLPEIGAPAGMPTLLVDSSPVMLGASEPGPVRVLGDATRLPLRAAAAGSVVAALADPFNHAALWTECARIGRTGAVVAFSTPSHLWSRRYRRSVGDPVDTARFETASGSVLTPSHVVPVDEQIALMEGAGLRVVDVRGAGPGALPAGVAVAPKLDSVLGAHDDAVTAFLAEVR